MQIVKKIVIAILLSSTSVFCDDCAFCNPQLIENQLVYKGDRASVIVTYRPDTEGHLMVIPNRHAERYDELTAEEIAEMGLLVQKIEAAEALVFGKRDYLILQKNGAGVGQSVPHVHIHFIPKPDDMSQLRFGVSVLTRHWFAALSQEETHSLAQEYAGYFEAEVQTAQPTE